MAIDKEENEGKAEIEFSARERSLVDKTLQFALSKARTPHGMSIETFDYDRAWELFVERDISRHLTVEQLDHVNDTQKADWIKELKSIHQTYIDGKNKGGRIR